MKKIQRFSITECRQNMIHSRKISLPVSVPNLLINKFAKKGDNGFPTAPPAHGENSQLGNNFVFLFRTK